MMDLWISIGLASHIFWWGVMSGFKGPAIPLCLLSALPAALLGPITFFFEGLLYWLTGPHDDPYQ